MYVVEITLSDLCVDMCIYTYTHTSTCTTHTHSWSCVFSMGISAWAATISKIRVPLRWPTPSKGTARCCDWSMWWMCTVGVGGCDSQTKPLCGLACLCVSTSVCTYLSLCVCFCASVCVFTSVCACLGVCDCLSLCVYLCVGVCFCVCLPLSLCVSMCIFVLLPLVYFCLPVC